MDAKTGWRWLTPLVLLVALRGTAAAEERTWTDKTGKFKVTAEFVGVEGKDVVLRQADGQEINVPLNRLSPADRAFIAALSGDDSVSNRDDAGGLIAQIAERFYSDLRSQERTVARQSLTKKAQALMTAGKSPLAGLPEPESGDRTIRTGKVRIEGAVAEIPVFVRAGGRMHKTKLHLRREGDQWVVFALSAMYPDGEKSINFEIAGGVANVDPLLAIVGKTFELEGYTLDGRPLNTAEYKGKIVLVDFWATWCGPCRAEIPNIAQTYQKHHADGFDVIAVSVDQDLNALQAFVAEEKPPWAVVADNHPRNARSMADKYGIRGIPAFILLGPDGKVATVHCRGQRLGQAVGQLIASGG
ncbi:MAG: redoxin family protein [Pirellulales bacterium]